MGLAAVAAAAAAAGRHAELVFVLAWHGTGDGSDKD